MDSKNNFVLLSVTSQPHVQPLALEVEGCPHAHVLPERRSQLVGPAATSLKLIQHCRNLNDFIFCFFSNTKKKLFVMFNS